MRRGDNIPPISDYAHYNEEAELIWYLENKYDMDHADEIIEDDERYDLYLEDDEPDFDEVFDTEEEAQIRYEWACEQYPNATKSQRNDYWIVEAWK